MIPGARGKYGGKLAPNIESWLPPAGGQGAPKALWSTDGSRKPQAEAWGCERRPVRGNSGNASTPTDSRGLRRLPGPSCLPQARRTQELPRW